MKRIFNSIITIAALAALVGCGAKQDAAQEETKVPVVTTIVQRGNVEQSLTYQGDIKAEYAVKVYSKIPDRIEAFYVDDGDVVTKGQPIAKIYATAIEQGVRQAEAGLAATRAQFSNLQVEYDRAGRLFKEGAMSKQQFDTIETQYKAAQAQVQQMEAALVSAKSSLQDATITAPITGIVGKRYLEVGDMASMGIPLAEIVQKDRVKITVDVTEIDLGKIKVGQKAKVTVKSYPDKVFEGTATKISPILDPMTRMATVEFIVDNPNDELKPGMFANVKIITGVLENVITVPRFATLENTSLERIGGKDRVVKKYSVFIVKNNKAAKRDLDISYINHINIAVSGGIEIGDTLVVEGQNNLRDNMAVSIIQEDNTL